MNRINHYYYMGNCAELLVQRLSHDSRNRIVSFLVLVQKYGIFPAVLASFTKTNPYYVLIHRTHRMLNLHYRGSSL